MTNKTDPTQESAHAADTTTLDSTLDSTRDSRCAASVGPGEGRWFLDQWMRILHDGTETGGSMSVIEFRGGQGFSPPLHLHHLEDTCMVVLDGLLTISIGGEERIYGPGETAWLPKELPHSFRIDSPTARYLEMITPAGFEGFHIEGSREVTSGGYLPEAQPIDVPALVAHAARYQCDIIGPPMAPA